MCATPASPVPAVLAWFDEHERPLPWRAGDPWGVVVSEFMLQQTPVHRVLPVWEEWLTRWPTPAALAAEPQGEAVRAWGRLGYPRRALRLHAAAVQITEQHGGCVPADYTALRSLPGVGDYTAAAICAFAFGQRVPVIDVNVERVLRRALLGREDAPARQVRAAAEQVLPRAHARAARWSAAVMELGALVCTARTPTCGSCPLRRRCGWHADGHPPAQSQRRRPQYTGSDRQARGAVLAALRAADQHVHPADLHWPDGAQLSRAIDSLIADGLITRSADRLHL